MADRDFTRIDHGDDPPSFRLERRAIDRWPVHGSATAICLGGDRFGQLHQLRLSDCSLDGLGAVSETVLEPGTMVSVGFQTPGMLPRQAVVLRCQPCGDGYRVGMQFSLRKAA
jgi:hypothetical protein